VSTVVKNIVLLIILALCESIVLYAADLSSIAVITFDTETSCASSGLDFSVSITNIRGGTGPYLVSYTDCDGPQMMSGIMSEITLTGFCYDPSLSQNDQKVLLTITDSSVTPCEVTQEVFPLNCSDRFSCDCCSDEPLIINVQATGEANNHSMVYVLTDDSGTILEISESGLFDNISDADTYRSYAINVEEIDLVSLLADLNNAIGTSTNDLLSQSSPYDNYCYATSVIPDLSHDCACDACTAIMIDAHPVCNNDGTFTISINSISGGNPDQCSDNYTVTNPAGSFLTLSAANLPQQFGTYSYTNQNDKITLTIIDQEEVSCMTSYDVLQLACLDSETCDCASAMPLTVSVQAAANGNGYSMIYAITNDQNEVIAVNQDGHFDDLSGDGTLVSVYAFNVIDADLLMLETAFVGLIGSSINDALSDSQESPFIDFCYSDFTPYIVDTDCDCPDCGISAVDLVIQGCNDNGTTSTVADDFFTFTLDVTQNDIDNFSNGFTFDGSTLGLSTSETGIYDIGIGYTSPSININSVGAQSVTLTLMDQDDSSCIIEVDLDIPMTCSVPNCQIVNVMHTVFPCDDEGTTDDPRDDTFGFSLSIIQGDPNSFNSGFTFDGTALGLSATESGAYGLSGYSINDIAIGTLAGTTVTVTIVDIDDPLCTNQVEILIPELCSDPVCNIMTELTNLVCDNAGTPGDATDDTYSFDVMVTGENTDVNANQTFMDDAANVSISYGATISYGPFLISDGLVTISYFDEDDAACISSVEVTPPATCSGATCEIIPASPTNILCSDNGTPANGQDDTFTFDVLVNGANDFPGAPLLFNDDQGNSTVAYGTIISYGPYLIVDGLITINYTDSDVTDCTASLSVAPPMSCSACPAVEVSAFPVCNSIGTSFDIMYEIASMSSYTIMESQANMLFLNQPSTGIISDFTYTNQNDKITLSVTDESTSCEYSVDVLQILCSRTTSCNCILPDPFSISIQASGVGNGFSMLYALVDNNEVIRSVNQTGQFPALPDDGASYDVYAFNVADHNLISMQLTLQNSIVITDAITTPPSNAYSIFCYTFEKVSIQENCDCTVCQASLTASAVEICLGDDVELSINITDGLGPFTVLIDTDGDFNTVELTLPNVMNGATTVVTPTSNTTYQLIAVTDESNNQEVCQSLNVVEIVVFVLPQLPITDQSVCSDIASVNLIALQMNLPFIFVWSDADGLIVDPTAVDPASGPFTYTYTDGGVCTSEGMVAFSINPLPAVSISGGSVICTAGTGMPSSLTLQSDPGFASYSWTASDGGVIVSQADQSSIMITSAGDYQVVILDDNGCTAMASVSVEERDCTPCSPIIADVEAVCQDDKTYSILFNSITGGDGIGEDFTVGISGSTLITYPTMTEITDLIYDGSDGIQSPIEIVITDDNANSCSTTISVFELNCAEQESCDCSSMNPYSINIQATAMADDHSMVYVLVNNDAGDVIVDMANQTGGFSELPDGVNYTVYAFNIDISDFENFSALLAILTSISSGDPVINQTSSFEDLCYDVQSVTLIKDCSCAPCTASLTTSDSDICLGDEIELTVNISDGTGPFSVEIDTDGILATSEISLANIMDGEVVIITPTGGGSYQIISATDEAENEICLSSGIVEITVSVLPALPIEDQEICADVISVDLTSLEMDLPFTFIWSNADGQISDPTDVDPASGPFIYSYTDGGPCMAEAQANYTILPAPSVSITGETEICLAGTGMPSTLTLQADEGFDSYSWTTDAGGIISGPSDESSITVTSGGEYTVTVIDDNGCGSSSSLSISEIDCTLCTPIEVFAASECNSDGTYSIIISSITGGDATGGGYEVTADGNITIQYPSVSSISGLQYVGTGDVQGKMLLSITDADSPLCATTTEVFELNCQDQESCNCNNEEPYSIQVQASGNAVNHEMVYVLINIDQANQVVGLANQSGSFPSLPDNTNYTVYAFNIESIGLTDFIAELSSLTSINAADPILESAAPFDAYCYEISEVSLIKNCECEAMGVCAIDIISLIPTCTNDQPGLYDIEICLSVNNNTASEFNVEIDGQSIGAFDYADLDVSGCFIISAESLNFVADGSEGIEVTVADGPISASHTDVYISELHYDNAGPDENEMVEITAPTGTDLTGYQIHLYNGTSGSVYGMPIELSGIISDAECGAIAFSIDGIQNGPDAIALVDPAGIVSDFISYEGSFLANAGPAQGITSIDIQVSEGDATSVNQSLELTDAGWQVAAMSSFGDVNNGLSCSQNMTALCADTDVYDEPRCIFDLALIKMINPNFVPPFNTGEVLSFDITIINQGNVDAAEIAVSDYADPSELIFQSVESGIIISQLFNSITVTDNGLGDFTISDLPIGDQVTITLDYLINPSFTENLIINNAEITASANDLNLPDIDSVPGDNAASDSDIVNDDDPTMGNDDFDPAVINLCAGEISPPIIDETLTVCSGDIININISAGLSEKPVVAESLFFSEYLEGSSRNKCLEIYNGTGQIIDLTDWSIEIYNNGNSSGASTFFPDGLMISDSDVLVICNSASDDAMLNLADVLLNAATNFNGNDDIVLVDPDGNAVDVIGTIGSALDFGTNQSFIRNCDIAMGRPVGTSLFIPDDEWDILEVDDVSDLGMHTYCATGLFPDECTYDVYLQNPSTGVDPILTAVERGFNINELNVDLVYPQVLYVTCVSPTGCESNPSSITLIVQEDQALSCNDKVQISLGDSCQYQVTPKVLLEADTGLSFYDVTLTRENGDVLDSALLVKSLDGKIIQYQLTDLCTGSSCWGEIAVEIKLRPELSSPCEFVLGTSQSIEADFSAGDQREFQAIITSDCQDLIIDIESDLKYNCGTGADVDWCQSSLDIIIYLEEEIISEQLEVLASDQVVLSNAAPGNYIIQINSVQVEVSGEFNISIQTTNCEPAQDCILFCGVNESVRGGFFRDAVASGGFVSLSAAASSLNKSCFQEVSDLKMIKNVDEDFCGAGTRTIVSYFGTIKNHLDENEKINLLTQAYVERKANINNILNPLPIKLACGASTHPDSIFKLLSLENNAISDSIAISHAYPYYILKNSDGDTLKRNATVEVPDLVHYQHRIDTVKVERFINGEWLLVDLINKELRDSIKFNRIRQSVTRLNPIPIVEKYCGYIVDYEDIVVPACGSGVKVLRSWSIIDWCDQQIKTLPIQQIENHDDIGPTIEPLNDQSISIQAVDCSAVYQLPEVEVFDLCTSVESILLTWQTLEGEIEDGYVTGLWEDDSPVLITLTASDECGNRMIDSMYLHISDQVAPVATCVDELQVSITDGDLAVVYTDAFDAGSHDLGCGDVWIKVIREEDLRGSDVGFWNTKGTRRMPDYNLQPDPSFAYRYSCRNEEADDFRATYFDENKRVLGVDIGRQVFFDDQASFCCTDTDLEEVMVVVRVFDVDPGEGAVDPRRMIQELASPTLIPDRNNKNRLAQSTNFVENDLYGHYTDCWVKVILEQKIKADIICADVTISCTDDLESVAPPITFGGICGTDDILLLQEDEISSACSITSIMREWYIDHDDNRRYSEGENSCIQTITISIENELLDPMTIKWPKHFNGATYNGVNIECDSTGVVEMPAQITLGDSFSCIASDTDANASVQWCDPACSLVAYTVDVDTIASGRACMKIIKRHSVIDWCLWKPNEEDGDDTTDQFEAVEDWAQGECTFCDTDSLISGGEDRVYFRYTAVSGDGYYVYDQVINIIDDTDPVMTVLDSFVIASDDIQEKDELQTCEFAGFIFASAQDFCNGGLLQDAFVNWEVIISDGDRVVASYSQFSDTIQVASGMGTAGEEYQVEWQASDGCGNSVSKKSIILFKDKTAPSPLCVQGVSAASLTDEKQAVIWASDFDLGSFDNCSALTFSITGRDADPILPDAEGFVEQQNIELACGDVGLVSELDVWVWDDSGNGAACPVSVLLSGSCDTVPLDGRTAFTIAGDVLTTSDRVIEGVQVTLDADLGEYPLEAMTGVSGSYSFLNNPYLEDYILTAKKDDDYLNGVTTADLVKLRSHILNINPLDSPYKLIAADINGDGSITAIDMVILTKLILGKITELPDNDSWRFVDADYEFIDQNNPIDYKELIDINRLRGPMIDQDFIGIKIGDLTDDSADGLGVAAVSRHQRNIELITADQSVKAGQFITVSLSIKDQALSAIRTMLYHDGLQLVNVKSQSGIIQHQEKGQGTDLIWINDLDSKYHSADLITLEFKVVKSGLISNMISLDSDSDLPIAHINNSSMIASVDLVFEDVNHSQNRHIQNEPNPFRDETVISFALDNPQEVNVTVYDVNGAEILIITSTAKAGLNEMMIDLKEIKSTGVLLYHIESGEYSETRKMIRLK